MKRYDAYKSTGIPWIPEVPEHWEVRKIKYVFAERTEKGYPEESILCATQKYGVIPQNMYENRVVVVNKGLENLKLVRQGNFVISLRSFQGGIEYAHYQGIISAAYTVLQLNRNIEAEYIKHLVKSHDFILLLQTCVTGLREGQNINYELLRKSFLPLPPLSEQRTIVAYIERKVRQIDTYIARQAEQIERLKELRKTIISHAVTCGIHPYPRFRPTGIPWIPDVPEHWECVELKRVTVFNPSRKENIDGDTLVGYAPMEIVRSNMESCLTIKVCKLTAGLTYFEEGDVVLAKVTPCFENGNVAIIPRMIHYCGFGSSELFVYRCKDKLAPKLLFYYFQSAGFVSAGTASMTGTGGLKRVSPAFARNAKIPLPPLSEQRAIVAYIEKKTAAVDRMINACHEQTELIKAYKQRLISDAVTGRIRVPEK